MSIDSELASKARILGGTPLWGTVSGSAADRLGMQGGDILLRFNGVPLQAAEDFRKGCRSLNRTFELEVLRGESLVRIELPPDSTNNGLLDEIATHVFGRAN